MRRLKKTSNFPKLESEIQINQTDLQNKLCSKDNRLQPDKATHPQDLSMFGGVYQESNSTADENILYAVEFVAYTDIDVNGESKTFVGVVATRIDYQKTVMGILSFR